MTAVTSTTDFDYEFDAAKGIQRDNLPPFAQRMRKAADLVWEEGYQQPFIRELGEGTLQRERFAFYLLQDFRYVNDYARVHALGLAKATDPEIMAFMLKVQNGALQVETEVHRSYLASYGITEEQMNNVRQSAFARAYTSNILSIAYGKDILDILVAVLPCAWVYADYGYRLAAEFADTLDNNPYKSWVDMYKTDEFWQDSVWLLDHIEKLVADASEERKRELIDIFVTGVENDTCSGPARTTCSTHGSPNGIRRADSTPSWGFLTSDCLFSLQQGGCLLIGFQKAPALLCLVASVSRFIRVRGGYVPRRRDGSGGRARNGCR